MKPSSCIISLVPAPDNLFPNKAKRCWAYQLPLNNHTDSKNGCFVCYLCPTKKDSSPSASPQLWNDFGFAFGFSDLFHSCITNRFLSFSPGLFKIPIDVLIVLNQHKTSHLSLKKEFILLDCLGFLSNCYSLLIFLALTLLQFIHK